MFPLLPAERLLATERVAAAIATRSPRAVPRPVAIGPATVAAGWRDAALIERALAAERRSLDRALVAAYLLVYPVRHAGFATLAAAAARAAERHDWRWRDAGRRWRLWEGVDAIRAAPSRAAALRDAGIVGAFARGAFAKAARRR